MTLYKRFRIQPKGVPAALYRVICLVSPKAVRSQTNDFQIEARTGDDAGFRKIALLVGLCKAGGLSRTPGGSPGTYGFEVVRNYDASDFEQCDLMLLRGQDHHQLDQERDGAGRLLLNKEFVQNLQIGSVWTSCVLSDDVRRFLESTGLVGMKFQEAVPCNQSSRVDQSRYWELRSSIVLPKMSNTQQLMYVGFRDNSPEPFAGDYSRWVFLNDPPYRSGEIHYRRSDLRTLGEFDIAETFELYRQPHRVLVISRRFYQTCLKHSIPLNLEPVRVDPD